MQTWLLWYSKDAEVCFKLPRIFQIFDIFLLFPGVIIFLGPPPPKKSCVQRVITIGLKSGTVIYKTQAHYVLM